MIRLLHRCDPHFGAADPVVAEAFLDRAKSLAIDLTFLSGDRCFRPSLAEATGTFETGVGGWQKSGGR